MRINQRRIEGRKVRICPEEVVFERPPGSVDKKASENDDKRQVLSPPRVVALRTSEASQALYSRGIRHPVLCPPNTNRIFEKTLFANNIRSGSQESARRSRNNSLRRQFVFCRPGRRLPNGPASIVNLGKVADRRNRTPPKGDRLMSQQKQDWSMAPAPVLEGGVVRLEPLERGHESALWDVARDHAEDIFRWISYRMHTPEDFHQFVEAALAEQGRKESVVFVTVERSSRRIIGSTRFMNIDFKHRRVEIGSTWIAPAWQRTAVNTEAKYLMLRHAFEVWKCFRVELKTDALNQKSRNAILRIGAKEEGTLRRHVLTWTGRVRDSVYFSIIDSEWPEVKQRLEGKVDAKPSR